jgi:hypothetical protein
MKMHSEDFRVWPAKKEHVETLSALQQQRRRHPARHVRSQSAKLAGFQFQTAKRGRLGTRFPLAHHVLFAGTGADRRLQSFLLRGSAGCPGASGDFKWRGLFQGTMRRENHLGRVVSLHRGSEDFLHASMTRTRIGSSALRTFTRGNTGRTRCSLTRNSWTRPAPITRTGTSFPPAIRKMPV